MAFGYSFTSGISLHWGTDAHSEPGKKSDFELAIPYQKLDSLRLIDMLSSFLLRVHPIGKAKKEHFIMGKGPDGGHLSRKKNEKAFATRAKQRNFLSRLFLMN